MPRQRKTDSTAIRELGLYIENDSDLYHRQQLPIEKNLRLKGMKGKYDPRKAPKLWSYLVESGAKKYAKEFGSPGQPWNKMFPKKERDELSRQAARAFEREYPTLMALRSSKDPLRVGDIVGMAKSRARKR
jgi:hypothetical protein